FRAGAQTPIIEHEPQAGAQRWPAGHDVGCGGRPDHRLARVINTTSYIALSVAATRSGGAALHPPTVDSKPLICGKCHAGNHPARLARESSRSPIVAEYGGDAID